MPADPCEHLLDNLNEPQREAVLHGQGPCLVVAGAGSGKTRVLTRRIAHLICRGVDPQAILAITFTNKAAGEMRERVDQLLGRPSRSMWISTFHAACVRILRVHAARLGYERYFTILDGTDQRALLKDIISRLNLDPQRYRPQVIQGVIDRAKTELLDPQAFAAAAGNFFEHQAARIYRAYQERLARENAVDFGDLIRLTVNLLEEHEDVRGAYEDQFQHVLIDEYQDTNMAQYRLLRLLGGRGNVFAVGDADQSVYRFRGADFTIILRFQEDFPDARIIRLEQNYRSTQAILDAANRLIGHNTQRQAKRLWTDRGPGEAVVLYRARDEEDEAAFVAGEIRRLVQEEGRPWSDFALLYRTHAQSRALEDRLVLMGMPYRIIGGVRFYERKEIKDLLAYLRLLVNPWDESAFQRAIAEPRRGIGPAAMARLYAFMQETGLDFVAACARAAEIGGLQKKQVEALRAFGRMLEELSQIRHQVPVARLLAELLSRSGYEGALQAEGSAEALGRLENLKELLTLARVFTLQGYDDTPEDFLAAVALAGDADTAGGEDSVSLLTMHSAKGLEFPVVFLVGLEEGLFPHARSLDDGDELEEERRLCYVGVTRAQERLYLTSAYQRMIFGEFRTGVPSRFLGEMGMEHMTVLDPHAPPVRREPAPVRNFPRRAAITPWGWNTAARPAAANHRPVEEVPGYIPEVGEDVIHPHWGRGTVLSRSGSGEDTEVTIEFPGAGTRTVLVRYALLRPVEEVEG
ncbi:MAG TPA: UvrD-helicase domain-containing protein [Sphingobacteriaceae bacterium]|nr:UvrD-helicase domain-containing protein [Sphingobacteriaceae bacterium]